MDRMFWSVILRILFILSKYGRSSRRERTRLDEGTDGKTADESR
jgi:hypothetical protein